MFGGGGVTSISVVYMWYMYLYMQIVIEYQGRIELDTPLRILSTYLQCRISQ